MKWYATLEIEAPSARIAAQRASVAEDPEGTVQVMHLHRETPLPMLDVPSPLTEMVDLIKKRLGGDEPWRSSEGPEA